MVGQCTVCRGGVLRVLYVRAVYCVVGWCIVWYGGVLCVREVYCVLGRCTLS